MSIENLLIKKLINFNGKEILTIGIVIGEKEDSYLVDFEYKNVEFRGYWKKEKCHLM